MSILIKGMKMPKNCDSCWLSRMRGSSLGGILDCKIFGTVGSNMHDPYDILNNRHPDCPLIELPEKHGRLVDADALHVLFENQWHYLQCLNWDENPKAEEKQTGINWCINTLHDDAPTIIEAEGDEEC